MMEEIFKSTEEDMKKAVQYFKNEIAGLRTGRASTALVEEIKVDYYGSKVPIKQLIEDQEGISEDEIKRALERLQKLTDKYIEEINHLTDAKEKEILG
jgi:ribosome recycling factor